MKISCKTVFVRTNDGYEMRQYNKNSPVKVTKLSKSAYEQGLEAQRAKKAMARAALSGVALSGGVAAGEAALGGAAAAAEVVGGVVGAAEVVAAIPTILTVAAIGGIGYGLFRGYKALKK